MNKKLSIKFISIVISVAMILTLIPVIAFNTGIVAKADPFGQMVDLIPEQREISDKPENDRSESLSGSTDEDMAGEDNEIKAEEELINVYVGDEDAGKTDRYIVKHKSGKESSFINKTADLAQSVTEIKSSVFVGESKGTVNKKSTIKSENSSVSLLVLDEKVLPSELAQTLKTLGAGSDIEYIQPDFLLRLGSLDFENNEVEDEITPITNMILDYAGDSVSSKEPVLVAVIDTGVDISHEALAERMAEGWNFPDNNDIVYDESNQNDYAHGTHIAGIIAETARQSGTNIKIMPLRVFNNGLAYTSDIIAAVEFANSAGAKIINCSFGSTEMNQALFDVIESSTALFVCAVGNKNRDLAETPYYPACYELPNIISVASANAGGSFSYFSNYGENIVDIATLGNGVISTLPAGEYGVMFGTSMSAAFVTGVAATCFDEQTSTIQLKEHIIVSADYSANLKNKVINGKWLNLEMDLDYLSSNGAVLPNSYESGYIPENNEIGEGQMELFSQNGGSASSVVWHSTNGVSLSNWNGKYGKDGYILFGHNANTEVSDAVALTGMEGTNSWGAVQVPKYKYDAVKDPGYLDNIGDNLYQLQMNHNHNNEGVIVAPDSWLDTIDRPRAGLDTPSTNKMTAAGVFAEGYSPAKTLTFDIDDDLEHIVTLYFTSWHGGGYDLTDDGKYFKSKVTFYDEHNNVLLIKNNDDGWGYYWDSNGDNWGDYSHAYVRFRANGKFSVKIEDSNKWRNLSGVFFDTENGGAKNSSSPSIVWHSTDGNSLGNWNGKYGNDGYILFGYNADVNVSDAVTLDAWEGGTDSWGAVQVPKYKYDAIKDPGYLNDISGNIYQLEVDHNRNDVGVVVVPDNWLNPTDRPRAGLDAPSVKKLTAAGIFAEGYSPTKTLKFDINDAVEHIVTLYFTSWHGGGYDLSDDGKYFKSKVTFYDENDNVLLIKDNNSGWGNYYDSNSDNWGDYSHAYVSFKVTGGFSVRIEDSNKWRNLSGVLFDTIENNASLVISTNSLPNGQFGEYYAQSIAVTGGKPITWSLVSGTLPNGLTLNQSTGRISGTPLLQGTYNFTVKATDYLSGDATKTFMIVIDPAAAANPTETPASSFSGSGTANDPYEITTVQQLNEVRNNLTAHYILVNDIDAGEFAPISQFRGTFNGNGYAVSNLYINQTEDEPTGLFGSTFQGTIKNVNLVNVNINGRLCVGGLIGSANGTNIENCTISGNGLIKGRKYVGGLVGYGDSITISNCSASISVEGGIDGYVSSLGGYTGGLVGYMEYGLFITNSHADGAVTSRAQNTGGFIGGTWAACTITNSYASGNLILIPSINNKNAGGFIGDFSGGTLSKCYAAGNVSGTINIGGLIGQCGEYATVENCYATCNVVSSDINVSSYGLLIGNANQAIVENCYSIGNARQNGPFITYNGLIGQDNFSVIKNSYFDSLKALTGVPQGQAKGTAQLIKSETFSGWDFTDIWEIYEDITYPRLKGIPNSWTSVVGMTGSGTENDPYVIQIAAQIDMIRNNLSAHYILANDIDLKQIAFAPIGSSLQNSFTGTFDGAGYTIKNLNINVGNCAGLFGYVSNAKIKNVRIENVSNVSGSQNLGAFAGIAENSTFENCHVLSGQLNGGQYAGGIVGSGSRITITKCSVSLETINGFSYSGGGLAGRCERNSIIENCFSTTYLTSSSQSNAGILVGKLDQSTMSYCYSIGNAKAGQEFRGLIGQDVSSVVTGCYFNKYKAKVKMPAEQAKRSNQLVKQSTFDGWDFNTIWTIYEDESYPYLSAFSDKIIYPSEDELLLMTNIVNSDGEHIVTFTAEDITDFSQITFRVKYDVAILTLKDFASQTSNVDDTVGIVEGTNIKILSHDKSAGIITFEVNRVLPNNKSYTGVLTLMTFVANGDINDEIMIEFTHIVNVD